MAEHRISCVMSEGTATFYVEGTFDGQAAKELRRSMDEVLAEQVVIDFSRVSSFWDAAIGVLSSGLSPHQLALRGLGAHQDRLFRYFGFQPTPTKERWSDC